MVVGLDEDLKKCCTQAVLTEVKGRQPTTVQYNGCASPANRMKFYSLNIFQRVRIADLLEHLFSIINLPFQFSLLARLYHLAGHQDLHRCRLKYYSRKKYTLNTNSVLVINCMSFNC